MQDKMCKHLVLTQSWRNLRARPGSPKGSPYVFGSLGTEELPGWPGKAGGKKKRFEASWQMKATFKT